MVNFSRDKGKGKRDKMEFAIKEIDGGVSFAVKIVPGSSRTSIEGSYDGMLKVKVAAPPQKGKANKELIAFLAKTLDIRKSDVRIVSGTTNPVKLLEIRNIDAAKLEDCLEAGKG
jgi:uncharacterized protein